MQTGSMVQGMLQGLRKWGPLLLKSLATPMIALSLASLGSILYMGVYDTFYMPNAKRLSALEETLSTLNKQAGEKKKERERYRKWEAELKNISSNLIPVPAGDSPKVVASSVSSKVVEIAKGLNRNPALGEALPSPHNMRKFISFKPVEEKQVNIAEGDPSAEGAGDLVLWQFRYELAVSGTYAALADLLNNLTLSKTVVDFDKITLKPPENAQAIPVDPNQALPAAVTTPGQPTDQTPVTMVLEFSLYLYTQ